MTTTTKRQGTIGRWMAAGAVAAALGLGPAAQAEAQYQRVQSAAPAVGSYTWGQNGYQYQYTGRGYVATGLRKVQPFPNVPQVLDIYNGQTWQQRLDYRSRAGAVLTPAARARQRVKSRSIRPPRSKSSILFNNQHW